MFNFEEICGPSHMTFFNLFFLNRRHILSCKKSKKCLFFLGNLFRDLKVKGTNQLLQTENSSPSRKKKKKNEWWKSVYVLMGDLPSKKYIYMIWPLSNLNQKYENATYTRPMIYAYTHIYVYVSRSCLLFFRYIPK